MATETVQVFAKDYQSDPVETSLRGGFDGALVTQNWIEAAISRGFGWHIEVGSFTTPIRGGGALDVFDANQPELVIDVPTGKTLVPLRIEIVLEMPLLAADDDEVESLIVVDQGALSAATDTNGVVEIPWNMRTLAAGIEGSAGVNIVSEITSDLTADPALDLELSHKSRVADVVLSASVANAFWTDYHHIYEPRHPLLIVGQSTLVVYWGGTVATSGYLQMDFLVIPTAKINDLQ